MATFPLTHLAQASVATNHRTHLAPWALISRAWYPDATAADLAQAIFLLMCHKEKGKKSSRTQLQRGVGLQIAEMVEIDHRPRNKEHLGNQQARRVMMIMKDQGKEDGMRDPPEGVGGWMMMMTRRMNLPLAMREDFPQPEGKP